MKKQYPYWYSSSTSYSHWQQDISSEKSINDNSLSLVYKPVDMGNLLEKKRVKMNVPEMIKELQCALELEDYLECKEIKDSFYESYGTFSETLKRDFRDYLERHLVKAELDNKKDLNGFFDEILDGDLEGV